MKLFKFWQKNKEQKAIRLAKKLRLVLIDLGYESPSPITANCIRIWEFPSTECSIEELDSGIKIVITITEGIPVNDMVKAKYSIKTQLINLVCRIFGEKNVTATPYFFCTFFQNLRCYSTC